jgi:NAD(P)-dependent dehydrogenase (short-subunit alcohol dehydrogenase family)
LRFSNAIAVVTGAASGIGAAIARRFAVDGAHVFVLDIDRTGAAGTRDAIRATGGGADAIECNVADPESVEACFSQLPRIDILVNNAGIGHVGNVEGTSAADFDRLFAVNVRGVFHCLRAALPRMRAQSRGVILNIGSVAARVGIEDRFAYSATKGAVHAMTLSVARDYLAHNIRCNCLCPARIHTPFVDAYLARHFAGREAETFAQLSKWQPIGRMGTPDEVAALAAFLCSDEAAFITGTAIDIDGGVVSLR